MENKRKKGFTLTELIIVIVIIGILAAVLIPTISGYIEKARQASDKADARNMNMLLSVEAYDLDMNYFEPSYLITLLESHGYDLISSSKKNSFYYDYTSNKIVLIENSISAATGDSSHPLLNNPINMARNMVEGYLYIDQGPDKFSTAVNTLANLLEKAIEIAGSTSPDDVVVGSDGKTYKGVITVMNELFSSIESVLGSVIDLDQYNPNKVVYVNDAGYFTSSTAPKTVIVVPGTVSLPEIPRNGEGVSLISFNSIAGKVFFPSSFCESDPHSFLVELPSGVTVIAGNEEVIASVNGNLIIEVSQRNSYTQYDQIVNLVIAYVVPNKIPGGENYRMENKKDKVQTLLPGGDFSVEFPNGIIKAGSTIDVKKYSNSRGFMVYDVRLFDASGALYARGTFAYLYL